MSQTVRIVIADGDARFRHVLKALLAREPDIEVTGETDHVDLLPAILSRAMCDVLLLDLAIERHVLAEIGRLSQRVSVLALTASEVPSEAFPAILLGARAVVFKRLAIKDLVEAIRTVSGGEVWMPASLQTLLADHWRNPIVDVLSRREQQVVRCIALGWRNAEVAHRLLITEATVKSHVHSVFRKLGIRSRVDLILYAIRTGRWASAPTSQICPPAEPPGEAQARPRAGWPQGCAAMWGQHWGQCLLSVDSDVERDQLLVALSRFPPPPLFPIADRRCFSREDVAALPRSRAGRPQV